MRKAIFKVPPDVIVEFTEKLLDTGFDNEIVGISRHDELEIEICYEKNEEDSVEELEEYLREVTDDLENDDDEQEDSD